MNQAIVMDKDGCVAVGDFKPREALKRIEKLEEIPFELVMEVTEKGATIDFSPFFKPEMIGKYRIRLEKIES